MPYTLFIIEGLFIKYKEERTGTSCTASADHERYDLRANKPLKYWLSGQAVNNEDKL